jgi:hypothetical protein
MPTRRSTVFTASTAGELSFFFFFYRGGEWCGECIFLPAASRGLVALGELPSMLIVGGRAGQAGVGARM